MVILPTFIVAIRSLVANFLNPIRPLWDSLTRSVLRTLRRGAARDVLACLVGISSAVMSYPSLGPAEVWTGLCTPRQSVSVSCLKGALYRIYQVIILCRCFPAKFSDIVSPARDSHA